MATAKRTRTVKKPAAKKAAAKKAAVSKANAEKEAKALIVKTENTLRATAKDINVRMEKAKKYADQADDMRLAASLRLAEAKQACDDAKIPFQKWCEKNLEFGWENARKLERIGREGEDGARKALADLRQKAALAQKKHREKKEGAQRQISGPTSTGQKSSKTELQQANEALDKLTEVGRKTFVEDRARNMGMVAIPADSYSNLEKVRKDLEKKQAGSALDRAKAAFDALSAADKMKLATYASEIIGATLQMPDFGSDEADVFDIPDYLTAGNRPGEKKKKAPARRTRGRKAA